MGGYLSTRTGLPYRAIEMGRGGYTVQKIKDNLTVNNDGATFGSSIITGVLSYCASSTANYLEKCQQALGTQQQPTYIVIDVGVNDVGFAAPWVLPNQTTWQNNYISILDTLNTQWPSAQIYLTKPWKRQAGGDETLFDTMAGWVDNVVAARPAFAHVLDDERVWFAGSPATYTSATDGAGTNIHWNLAGQTKAAQEKLAVLP